MSTLDHNFNDIASKETSSEVDKASYPPPFSIRFTFEERARLDTERGRHSIAAHIRERLFGDQASVRKKPGNSVLGIQRRLDGFLEPWGRLDSHQTSTSSQRQSTRARCRSRPKLRPIWWLHVKTSWLCAMISCARLVNRRDHRHDLEGQRTG